MAKFKVGDLVRRVKMSNSASFAAVMQPNFIGRITKIDCHDHIYFDETRDFSCAAAGFELVKEKKNDKFVVGKTYVYGTNPTDLKHECVYADSQGRRGVLKWNSVSFDSLSVFLSPEEWIEYTPPKTYEVYVLVCQYSYGSASYIRHRTFSSKVKRDAWVEKYITDRPGTPVSIVREDHIVWTEGQTS